MILNEHQAEAIYTAMTHLNQVCGRVQATFGLLGDAVESGINVFEDLDGCVHVVRVHRPFTVVEAEMYTSQGAFAQAYDLDY